MGMQHRRCGVVVATYAITTISPLPRFRSLRAVLPPGELGVRHNCRVSGTPHGIHIQSPLVLWYFGLIIVDGILYEKAQTNLIQCPGGKTGDVIIPNTVTAIGNGAFAGCSAMTSITSLAVIPPVCTGETFNRTFN